jgi:hypothetical protein
MSDDWALTLEYCKDPLVASECVSIRRKIFGGMPLLVAA